MSSENCPCHSGKDYDKCCGAYHTGRRLPSNALVLMRSRYSAYAKGLTDYIMDTTHRNNKAYIEDREKWGDQIRQFSCNTEFKKLEILDFEDGNEEAYVTFNAFLSSQGENTSFRERSRFLLIEGRWLYEGGKIF